MNINYLLTDNKEHKININNEKIVINYYKERNIGNLHIKQAGEDFYFVFNLDSLNKLITTIQTLLVCLGVEEERYISVESNIIYGEDHND